MFDHCGCGCTVCYGVSDRLTDCSGMTQTDWLSTAYFNAQQQKKACPQENQKPCICRLFR